jgi:CheY-like chemotaxis protein
MSLDKKVAVIADDDIVVRHILTAILENDFTVITHQTGEECLEYFKSNSADILFLDIQLPDYTGPDVLNILATKLGADKPYVVGVSANPEREMRELFSGTVPDAFLEKPFTSESVAEVVEKVGVNASAKEA